MQEDEGCGSLKYTHLAALTIEINPASESVSMLSRIRHLPPGILTLNEPYTGR